MRLFCLPYAGGGTVAFRPWLEHLPDEIELCLVQLPGREARMRETPYRALEDLTSDLVPALDPFLDRPFALFGHSMGALIAFTLAHDLRLQGLRQPAHLFVSGRRAPHIPDTDAPLHQLPDAAFVAALVRRYNGIPKAILQDLDLLRLFLPTIRADLTMIETHNYVEAPPLECPITAFGGWDDTRATQVDVVAWRDMTRGDFALHMFPGGHFFIQTATETLVAKISGSFLDAAVPPGSRMAGQHFGTTGAGIAAHGQSIE